MDTKNCKERFVKIFLSVLIVLSASTFLHSQITISQSQFLELLTPGKLLYTDEGSTGIFNIGGINGPNIYDFTSVNLQNLSSVNNYEVSQIPALAARYPSNATIFGDGLQNIVNNPIFLSINDSTYVLGKATVESIYRFVHKLPYELYASFPMNFQQIFSQSIDVYDTTYNLNWQVLSTDFYNTLINVSIDGYGTLKLPGKDLECLRVKREYSWFQFKEFNYITREGVIVYVTDIPLNEPDTGYVNGYRQLLLAESFVNVEDENTIPTKFSLEQNYPNPFNPSTTISFSIPERSYVNLKVYDVLGNEVVTLVSAERDAGNHTVNFYASELPSGVYFYKMTSGNYSEIKKMMVLK
jgi:hypothetical protein